MSVNLQQELFDNIDDINFVGASTTTMITGSITSPIGNLSSGTYTITNGNTNPYMYTTVTTPGSYVYTTDGITANWKNNDSTLHVKGDAEFEGDVTIKGKSIIESLEKIEEKLAILHPNEQLEEKWGKLRELRKQYMELEKEIIEKETVWDILKK